MNDNDYLKLEWHAKMISVARERWPEMPESPNIVGASSGVLALEMAIYEPRPSMIDRPDLLAERDPPFKRERIELEQVGMYQLGYGPITQTLYVGSEGG